ncbi:hypothetical protein TRFO_39750 [Tritrichomonas foetus]|uniref:Protein ZIP4 homolog n=1 Tax=Tritrichomonas foetus TaxID=1144522 RepID=A0A1J4J3M9_9EUKA|nr:hypothetical protein TRFO_39750 [Tritrichomonas foetus]|eukprot:OHS94064.1 hypothetical protein TRFO_39750 [Tritrichomonas foetus]
MSISFEVEQLEKCASGGDYNLSDRITNLSHLLVDSEIADIQLTPNEAKNLALHIWNTAVKLQRVIPKANPEDQATLKLSIIPQLRILTVNVFEKHLDQNNEDDKNNLFYFLAYAYKAMLESDNIEMANKYLTSAQEIFPKLIPSANSIQTFVNIQIWQSQNLISNNNSRQALQMLQKFFKNYSIESSCLVSFIYEKAVEFKSIEWCNFCLQLVKNSSALSDEWESIVLALLVQLHINQGNAEEAMKLIHLIPSSLNSSYLELKCLILLNSQEKNQDSTLMNRLISFIPKTEEDRRVLVALCIFVADNCYKLGNTALEFIKNVMKIKDSIDSNIIKHVWYSSIRIACELNEKQMASQFLDLFNEAFSQNSTNDYPGENLGDNLIETESKREIAGILWNKALVEFDHQNYEEAATWMQLSRSQMSELDFQSQSCCFRFISRCMFESQKLNEALLFAEEAIQYQQNNAHGYLLKFRILASMQKEKEASDFISDLLNNSAYLEEFEPAFFTSMAAELHLIGNDNLALDILLKFIGLSIFIPNDLKINGINSIFAILQQIDQIDIIFKSIKIVASKWDDENMEFNNENRAAYSAIAYNVGYKYRNLEKFKKAAESFECGSLFSGTLIEYKYPCAFQAIDCLLKYKNIPKAYEILDSISILIDKAEQKYKDGLTLSKFKISLISQSIQLNSNIKCDMNGETRANFKVLIDLIDEVTTPAILAEICDFICENKTPPEIIMAVLNRAKQIENLMNHDNNEKIAVSLLHQLVIHSSATKEDLKNSYELVVEFIEENHQFMNDSQLQFFMSRAWNVGVQLAKSLRVKEAEWWLNVAITIMMKNEELKKLYSEELNDRYLKFLDQQKNRLMMMF